MRTIVVTVCLLIASNVFMTFAWYAHLRNLSSRPWYVAAFASWGIALFEYLLQVPANRIGYHQLSLAQLKIVQEVVTLSVFVPFAVFYMRQPMNLNFLWAGLCLPRRGILHLPMTDAASDRHSLDHLLRRA
jgi:uncharacterized protein (DUF486 family)